MSVHRWGAKRDSTEASICDALRKLGVFVVRISSPGAPDLLCRTRHGFWFPLEVKGPKTKVSAKQAEAGYTIVRSVDEAIELFRVKRFPL